MQSRSVILLKNLLRSTSGVNILRYEKDKKKRSKVIGGYIGLAVLYAFLMAYVILNVIGYGYMGLAGSIPVLGALLISLMTFFLTVLKTNGYLFAFKEYDMLMALPFKPSEVAGTKFLYMYVKSLPMVIGISLATMIGYGIYEKVSAVTYILWIVLSVFLPLIPMVLASTIGALIARAGSGFRHKQLIQTILTFIFIIICFASRFIIEAIVKNNKVDDILNTVSDYSAIASKYYLPAKWFEKAILSGDVLSALLFVVVSLAIFVGFATLVGKSYRKINSNLKTSVARREYKMGQQKKKSIINTIVFKEFKRFTGSTLYITNMGFGEVLTLVLAIAVLFVDMNSLIAAITNGAPLTKENLIPAIPFIVYFLVGMMPTTVASLSLEGKNFWILKSLPVDMTEVIKGKVMFNMCLTVPFMLLAITTISIKSSAGFLNLMLALILGVLMCGFSSLFGMNCNLSHCKLDWENEMEVVKQGAAAGIYMLVNMIGISILVVGVVALGMVIPSIVILPVSIILFTILDILCYKGIVTKSREL